MLMAMSKRDLVYLLIANLVTFAFFISLFSRASHFKVIEEGGPYGVHTARTVHRSGADKRLGQMQRCLRETHFSAVTDSPIVPVVYLTSPVLKEDPAAFQKMLIAMLISSRYAIRVNWPD